MGQYYRIAFKKGRARKATVNARKYRGSEYVMAKLMEHGYLGNTLCMEVAAELEDGPTRLAWVGDYAEDDELKEITRGGLDYEQVWGESANTSHVFNNLKPNRSGEFKFDYKGKFLVNRTKGEYISFDKYVGHYGKDENDWRNWPICPFAVLTAVGNGRGGGDYGGTEMERVGSWAWDELEITSEEPKGLTLLDIAFKEEGR